jgi:hypothetical protein
MAVGTVSTVEQDNWQLIATNSPSAASSSTFSSVAGYKKLMLVFKNMTTSVGGSMRLSFNSDTTAHNYMSNTFWGPNGQDYASSYILLGTYPYTTQPRGGYAVIENVNQSMPHTVNGASFDAFTIAAAYLVADPITSVTITGPGGTLTGTLSLYGIAA